MQKNPRHQLVLQICLTMQCCSYIRQILHGKLMAEIAQKQMTMNKYRREYQVTTFKFSISCVP